MTSAIDRAISIAAAEPRRDATILHGWLTDQHAAFWGMGQASVEEVHDHLTGLEGDPDQSGWIGTVDRFPAFYVETYNPAVVLFGGSYKFLPGDLGMHILISGPGDSPSHGFTDSVFAAVMTWCFHQLGASRVVVEPDVRNSRIRAKNARAGFRELCRVVLGEGASQKVAALSICTREGFARSDLATALQGAPSSGNQQ